MLVVFLLMSVLECGSSQDDGKIDMGGVELRRKRIEPLNNEPQATQPVLDMQDKWGQRLDINLINHEFLAKTEALYRRTIRTKIIGKSHLGKQIYALEIQHSINKGATVFIDGGQNGNEWQSVNLALYVIQQLLSEHMALLLWLRVVVVPLVNPDGYEVAQRNSSFNTNVNKDNLCSGVNIARNFEEGTRQEFVSCEKYQGGSRSPEIETRNIKRYFEELQDVKLYITLHSGYSFLAYPYANTDDPHNSSAMARNMYRAISGTLGSPKLDVQSLYDAMGERFRGSALDWAATKMKVDNCIYMSVDKKTTNHEEVFRAYFEGIKYAIIQLQLTDTGVALAFSRECMSKRSSSSRPDSIVRMVEVVFFFTLLSQVYF